MAETEKAGQGTSGIWQLWSLPLTQRLVVLSGLLLMGLGYAEILSTSSLPDQTDVQEVTRHALGGMALVICGGVVEVLVMLEYARR